MNKTTSAAEVSLESPATFEGLGIHEKFLVMLNRAGYTVPTPIQQQSIPISLKGEDVLGIAQTGTGKTLAFGVPMIQRLVQEKGMGLVVLPTRELAVQVESSLHRIGKEIGLRTALLIGGEPMGKQMRALRSNPYIIIATPGRLIDHLEQKTISLDTVKVLVLDEADRMLDMGFAPQLKRILQSVPAERQTMLFSATMPDEIVKIAAGYMKLPVRVEVARAGTASKNITQEVVFVHKADKLAVLKQLLSEEAGNILVFSRTKFGAKKIASSVRDWGFSSTELHSNRTLNQRLSSLQGFKTGKYKVLVATDIAARGIDVTGIALVVNFDLPMQAEDYVHRIGRTGRAGLSGKAISFAAPEQRRDVRDIERLIGQMLPVKQLGKIERLAPTPRSAEQREERPRTFAPRTPRAENPFSTKPRTGFGGRSHSGKSSAGRSRSSFGGGAERSSARPSFGRKPSFRGGMQERPLPSGSRRSGRGRSQA